MLSSVLYVLTSSTTADNKQGNCRGVTKAMFDCCNRMSRPALSTETQDEDEYDDEDDDKAEEQNNNEHDPQRLCLSAMLTVPTISTPPGRNSSILSFVGFI